MTEPVASDSIFNRYSLLAAFMIFGKAGAHAGSAFFQATSYLEYGLGIPQEDPKNYGAAYFTAFTCFSFSLTSRLYYLFDESSPSSQPGEQAPEDPLLAMPKNAPLLMGLMGVSIIGACLTGWGGPSSLWEGNAGWAVFSVYPALCSLALFWKINVKIVQANLPKMQHKLKSVCSQPDALFISSCAVGVFTPLMMGFFNYDLGLYSLNKLERYFSGTWLQEMKPINELLSGILAVVRFLIDIFTKSYLTYSTFKGFKDLVTGEKHLKIKASNAGKFLVAAVVLGLFGVFELLASDCGMTMAFARTVSSTYETDQGSSWEYVLGYVLSVPGVISQFSYTVLPAIAFIMTSMLGLVEVVSTASVEAERDAMSPVPDSTAAPYILIPPTPTREVGGEASADGPANASPARRRGSSLALTPMRRRVASPGGAPARVTPRSSPSPNPHLGDGLPVAGSGSPGQVLSRPSTVFALAPFAAAGFADGSDEKGVGSVLGSHRRSAWQSARRQHPRTMTKGHDTCVEVAPEPPALNAVVRPSA
jgi:hypothetical protein